MIDVEGQVRSPLTHSTNVVLDKEIQCDFIVENYKRLLDIDVRKYFQGLDQVQVYTCLDTGFRFYHPFSLEGDSRFYEQLQVFPWYYVDWKWEYEIASPLIKSTDKVLEIGCARGSFLDRMAQRGAECVGLELNPSAADAGRGKGLNILTQSIQEHARLCPERYDLVCFFQVAEHVASIREFIQSSIRALKPGGTLVIGVPNNDSVIFKDRSEVLNMPPHHVGLWNLNSLLSVQKVFGIELVRVEFESLQNHSGYAVAPVRQQVAARLSERLGIIGGIVNRISRSLVSFVAVRAAKHMIGHTIFAQYTKPGSWFLGAI
jgi:2-polyprenyl-3-methyl-5-hydroxy-6-metoxy-1,4-benzoquinol methylase